MPYPRLIVIQIFVGLMGTSCHSKQSQDSPSPVQSAVAVTPHGSASAVVSIPVIGFYNIFLHHYDMSGDGKDDLLLGGMAENISGPTPIVVMQSEGNGSFSLASGIIPDDLVAMNPISEAADVNQDGILDFIVYDGGKSPQHESSDFSGGFDGGLPSLLQSTGRTWSRTTGLEAAAAAANSLCADFCETGKKTMHVKHLCSGDIDGDGEVDLFVESGGGYRQSKGHFLRHSGGTFQVAASDPVYDQLLRDGPPESNWRWGSQLLHDMNGDGFDDLIMGRLAKPDNRQDDMRNLVVINDGSGHFRYSNRVPLPQPGWNEDWTYVKAIAVSDLNGDGLPDIVLSHERSNGTEFENTGRFLQFLLQTPDGNFADESALRAPDQALTVVHECNGHSNYSTPRRLKFMDINGDGHLDLFAETNNGTPLDDCNPSIYLNDGAGRFSVELPSTFIVNAAHYLGRSSTVLDANGDGLLDLVVLRNVDGPDGIFASPDDDSVIDVFLRR